MALVLFGGGVTQFRGSIGGTTFSKTKGGAIARARTKPINPRKSAQLGPRAYLAHYSGRWGTGPDQADRDNWNTYALNTPMLNKLGQTTYLSGHQHYVRRESFARYLRTFGTFPSQSDDAPTSYGIATDTSVLLEESVGDLVITDNLEAYLDPILTEGEGLLVSVYGPQPLGRSGAIRYGFAAAISLVLWSTIFPVTILADADPGRYYVWARRYDGTTLRAGNRSLSQLVVVS